MVYVFGIDIPLMELLLVYSFLTLYILTLVFLELRKLSKLIKIEQFDIGEIEGPGKKPIDAFIRSAIKKGYTKKEIKKVLKKRGWTKKQIKNVMIKY